MNLIKRVYNMRDLNAAARCCDTFSECHNQTDDKVSLCNEFFEFKFFRFQLRAKRFCRAHLRKD